MKTVVVGQVGAIFEDSRKFLLSASPGRHEWQFDFERLVDPHVLCEVFVSSRYWTLVLDAAQRSGATLIIVGYPIYAPYPALKGVVATKIVVILTHPICHQASRISLSNKIAALPSGRSVS
jgi:hypothetical protein